MRHEVSWSIPLRRTRSANTAPSVLINEQLFTSVCVPFCPFACVIADWSRWVQNAIVRLRDRYCFPQVNHYHSVELNTAVGGTETSYSLSRCLSHSLYTCTRICTRVRCVYKYIYIYIHYMYTWPRLLDPLLWAGPLQPKVRRKK